MSRTRRQTVKPPGFRGKFYKPPSTKAGGPRRCSRCGKVTTVSKHALCSDCKKALGRWV